MNLPSTSSKVIVTLSPILKDASTAEVEVLCAVPEVPSVVVSCMAAT